MSTVLSGAGRRGRLASVGGVTLAAATFGVGGSARAALAQSSAERAPTAGQLSLGFAVDTTAVPGGWWGVDPALAALPAVVRTWRDYLAVRADSARRRAFWSAADRARAAEPDLALVSESYILEGRPLLVEALPVVAGDASRWVLRTVHVGVGSAARPGLLAMERTYVVRETDAGGGARWVLVQPAARETAGWRRTRSGAITYVVHPAVAWDARQAAATAAWADSLVRRFGLPPAAPVTYYQVPDLQAGQRVMGFDWAISADRAGGRANPEGRIVIAADPRYGAAYRHELVHVLLAPLVAGRSGFVGEGLAYWLGGARGRPFGAMLADLAGYLAGQPTIGLRDILAGDGTGVAGSAQLPAAAALFELAHRRGGDAAVRRFIAGVGAKDPTLDDVARAFGVTPDVLEAEWWRLVRAYGVASRQSGPMRPR